MSILNKVFNTIALQFSGMGKKEEIRHKVNEFKQDYMDFYNGRKPFTRNITQLYWYKLFLSKRRLDHNGITLDATIRQRIIKGEDPLHITWSNDGKYISANVVEDIYAKKIYIKENKRIGRTLDTEVARYIIVDSIKEENSYTCPNCGYLSSQEKLIDGCDHCGTKFQLEDFDMKISSFQLERNTKSALNKMEKGRSGIDSDDRFRILIAIFLFMGIGIGIIWSALSNSSENGGWILGGFMGGFIGAMTGVGLYVLFLVKGAFIYFLRSIPEVAGNIKNVSSNISFENHVKKHDPLFSIDVFQGNIENKIMAIHFARNLREISAFAKLGNRINSNSDNAKNGYDMNTIIESYENVMDCNLVNMQYLNYFLNEHNQVLTVSARIKLLVLKKNKLKTKRETVDLTLIKDRNCTTQQVCEGKVFACQSCGATISLLNGGQCEFCSSEMELRKYDWVIVNYRKR